MTFRLLCAVFLCLSFSATAVAEIRLRFGDHGDYTRIVLEAPDEPLYRIFNLEDPSRLVVDLREVKLSRSRIVNKGLVKGYRFGQFEAGVTRVVFDLTDNFRVREFFSLDKQADKGFRIVIDVEQSPHAVEFLRYAKGWNNYASTQKALAATAPKPEKSAAAAPNAAFLPLIAIDPGHGGVDPGAVSKRNTYEKNITLAAAKVVAETLRKSGRYRVLLTRNKDIYLPLRKRYKIAEDNDADLLISLHADSLRKSTVRGVSVYTLSEKASDAETAKLAARENAADSNAGYSYGGDYDTELVQVLLNIEQRGTRSESAKIAGQVVKALKKDKQLRIINNPHRFAGFAVLKSPSVPSILVEMGFISNPQEEKLLQSKKYHRQFADMLLRSLDAYFDLQKF